MKLQKHICHHCYESIGICWEKTDDETFNLVEPECPLKTRVFPTQWDKGKFNKIHTKCPYSLEHLTQ